MFKNLTSVAWWLTPIPHLKLTRLQTLGFGMVIVGALLYLTGCSAVPLPSCGTTGVPSWDSNTATWVCEPLSAFVTPAPTASPQPTSTPIPTSTPAPTATPRATATPQPTSTPPATPRPLLPMIDPQVNLSSVGDTYTDTLGSTLAETTNQTRLTTTSTRARQYVAFVSCHVSAGTGTVQFYDVTTTTSLGSGTCTNTSASTTTVALNVTLNPTNVTPGDVLTLRVQNNTPLATITVDGGGIFEVELGGVFRANNSGTSTLALGLSSVGFIQNMRCFSAKGTAAATYSVKLYEFVGSTNALQTPVPHNAYDAKLQIGATLTEADSGTIGTFTPPNKLYGSSAVPVEWGALSGSAIVGCAFAGALDAN